MAVHPDQVRRRLVPDETQLQVILGSLLGRGRISGAAGRRWMRVEHPIEARDFVWWKYERLSMLAREAPREEDGRIGFRTIAHPVFDDLAPLLASEGRVRARALLAPLGIAVWMTDLGRLELRPDAFLPQRVLRRCA